MALQGFFDESEGLDGTFVLAGHISTAERWAAFAAEWEENLPYAVAKEMPAFPVDELNIPRNADKFHVKMSAMNGTSEFVPLFFRIIERHVVVSVSVRINVHELDRARARIVIPSTKIYWDLWELPYLVAWRCLMDKFNSNRNLLSFALNPEEPVEFFFDERSEKKHIKEFYREYISFRAPEMRRLYDRDLHFERDEKFLGLQAADLWAWWVRKWWSQGVPDTMEHGEGYLGLKSNHPKMDISVTEDDLVEFFVSMAREQIGPTAQIYDLNGVAAPRP